MNCHDMKSATAVFGKAGAVLAAALLTVALPGSAEAEDFPSHELTFVVPFEPGANGDIIVRLVAEGLSERLGQPVVVENRSGAGGMVGTAAVARMPADGYTMVLVANVQAVNATVMKDTAVDIAKDLRGVTLMTKGTSVLVVPPDSPFQTTGDFIAYARAHPGELSYASSGIGSTGQLTMEQLKLAAGLDIQHVPYKGGTQMYTDLIAGRVDIGFGSTSGAPGLIAEGKLRGLGITSLAKMSVTGDLPPIADEVPGFEAEHWQGVMVPVGVPEERVQIIYAAFSEVLADPETDKRLEDLGLRVIGSEPAEFDRFVADQIAQYAVIVEKAGIGTE